MRRFVRLSDLSDMPTPAHDPYAPELMNRARAALVARGLRYDNKTGIVRDDSGWLSRFSNPADHEPHASLEDVMRWAFRSYIANGASRLSRGYDA